LIKEEERKGGNIGTIYNSSRKTPVETKNKARAWRNGGEGGGGRRVSEYLGRRKYLNLGVCRGSHGVAGGGGRDFAVFRRGGGAENNRKRGSVAESRESRS